MDTYVHHRELMAQQQLMARGIHNIDVINAMRTVPRHEFVPPVQRHRSYEDTPLPIGYQQTISQPYMVAFMIQEAKITKNDRVLEIGAGCGYAAAVIGQIAQQVWAYEILPPLGEAAAEKIKELGYMNVNIKCGDGLKSSAAHGPFNAILVAACATKVPTELKELLALNGNLIIPVEMNGPNSVQILKRVVRIGEDEFLEEALEYVMFVPLIETP